MCHNAKSEVESDSLYDADIFVNNTMRRSTWVDCDTANRVIPSPYYYFTSCLYFLSEQYNDILDSFDNLTPNAQLNADRGSNPVTNNRNSNNVKPVTLCKLLLDSLLVDSNSTSLLAHNPIGMLYVVMCYWFLGLHTLAMEYIVSCCVEMMSMALSSSRDGSGSVNVNIDTYHCIHMVHTLQLVLYTGRLYVVEEQEESGPVSSDNISNTVPDNCLLDAATVTLLCLTSRVLLAYSCLHYRYDVVKILLEEGPIPLQAGSGSGMGATGIVDKDGTSKGAVALSKFWGPEVLLGAQLSKSKSVSPQSYFKVSPQTSPNSDLDGGPDEPVDMDDSHSEADEGNNGLDRAYEYFVDVCKEDANQVSLPYFEILSALSFILNNY